MTVRVAELDTVRDHKLVVRSSQEAVCCQSNILSVQYTINKTCFLLDRKLIVLARIKNVFQVS